MSIYDQKPPKRKLVQTLRNVHSIDQWLRAHPEISDRRPSTLHGMRPALLRAPIFVDQKNPRMSQLMLAAGVYGLMLQNLAWLQSHPETPALYESGVCYKPERRREYKGQVTEYGEEWQTIPWVIYRGYGDCEDLGAWRAAELRYRYNIPANPYVKMRRMPTGAWRAHVVVRWPDGRFEDPAAKLGMYTFSY